MKTKMYSKLFLLIAALFTATLSAQVRVGGENTPTQGAILDLNSTDKGSLLLSNVNITSIDSIPIDFVNANTMTPEQRDINTALTGSIVYNVHPTIGPGIFLWNGDKWLRIHFCTEATITSTSVTNVNIKVGQTTNLPKLSVSASGESLTYRWYKGESGVETDLIAGAIGNTYTVLATDVPANGGFVIKYWCKVSTEGCGSINSPTLTVRNCGAWTASKTWLDIMCHNLGADESLDPFTWNNTAGDDNRTNNGRPDTTTSGQYKDIKGYLYQWGRYNDGHQYRNSTATATGTVSGRPSVDQYNAAVADYKSDGTAISYNKFYSYLNDSNYDWISNEYDSSPSDVVKKRWGDGTSNASMDKAQNDPCPLGWKVPSQDQWSSIFWDGTTSGNTLHGYKVGDALFLPAAGCRYYNDGSLANVSSYGYYWSSKWNSSASSNDLYFSGSNIYPDNHTYRTYGFSVRCVAE
jgi:hypothetical protein